METISSNDNNEEQQHLPPWKAVSFSCGGWLQFYLFGVARAMQVKGNIFLL